MKNYSSLNRDFHRIFANSMTKKPMKKQALSPQNGRTQAAIRGDEIRKEIEAEETHPWTYRYIPTAKISGK